MSSGNLITRAYGNFRGADFRGEEINFVRSPDCYNVWKDYKHTDSIRTRPDIDLLHSFPDKIYGIFFYNEMLLVHSGTNLYKVVDGIKTVIYEDLNTIPSDSFIYNGTWYFKDGKHYLQYNGGDKADEVVGYIPTTSISKDTTTSGNFSTGKTHEDVNLLSPYRYNTFCGNGENRTCYLDTQGIDRDFLPEVKINGEKVDGVTNNADGSITYNFGIDYDKGVLTFTTACIPPAPLTDGQDNISIKFKKTINGSADSIRKCTLLQVFDNRVFFSGNPDFPNRVYHCSLNEPSYCSDLDYYNEGLDSAAVKGMVAGNNSLWVFKEPSQANTSVFYHTPAIDSEYGKVYPSTHSTVSMGCVGKAINFNDDIVFFSERGMESVNGDITTEQFVAHRSSLVDSKLIAEKNYKNMILQEWEGYLLVIIDNRIYLADSRATFTNENHIEYEWFYFEFDKVFTCANVYNGVLHLGTADGVYTLTNTTNAVKSYWVTPKDKFNYPQYMKTTNKKGCVVEATGDISVYAKTDKSGFELISEFHGVTDAFVCRIKRKKFKDIQLKFHSDTGFTLETATLECFIGGYLKR